VAYDSLASLFEEPRLAVVVEGTVTGVASESTDPYEAGAVKSQISFTDFAFQVEETLFGDVDGTELIIHQTGSRSEDVLQEIHDDPLFEVGDRYVLFLAVDPRSGTYFALGPAARVFVRDGEVFSLSHVYPDRDIRDLGLGGMPIQEFRAAVRAAAEEAELLP